MLTVHRGPGFAGALGSGETRFSRPRHPDPGACPCPSEFRVPAPRPADVGALSALFQDGGSCSDCSGDSGPGSRLPSFVLQGKTSFPELFQTGHLLFYERFAAYQDYILGGRRSRRLSVCGVAVNPGPQPAPIRSGRGGFWGAQLPSAGRSLSSVCVMRPQPTARPLR